MKKILIILLLLPFATSAQNWSKYYKDHRRFLSTRHDTLFVDSRVGVGTLTPTTKFQIAGRFAVQQGADVASANNLALGSDGNLFEITGTTQINLITATGWVNGSEIVLMFSGSLTVKHGQATTGSDVTILLPGAADYSASSGKFLRLILSEIGGAQAWREPAR